MAHQDLFEQKVSDSDGLRAEQARELDRYILALKSSTARRDVLFSPKYSSVRAYLSSARGLRARLAETIGYPPPGDVPKTAPSFTRIGDDSLGTYFRAVIPILPQVNSEGIFILPKGAKGRVPLVISMHGGGGSPEVALFNGGANYHDMVRGGVRRGYAVYAPQHLFSVVDQPRDIRTRTDDRLRLVGTTITAVEIAKITRALDVLLKRPEIDPNRVAMVGLSYGGFYSLVAPALEPRIKVSVSSCYFGVQEWRYERDELSVPSDFRFPGRFTETLDTELGALICPRPLLIQAGKNDNATHRDGGISLAPKVAEHYKRLGKPENFAFHLFDGGHEFDDKSAWSFVETHL